MALIKLIADIKAVKMLTGGERAETIEKICPRFSTTTTRDNKVLFMYAVKYGIIEIAKTLFDMNSKVEKPFDPIEKSEVGVGIIDNDLHTLAVASGNLDLVRWVMSLIEEPDVIDMLLDAIEGRPHIVYYLFDTFGDKIRELLPTADEVFGVVCCGRRLKKYPHLFGEHCEIMKFLVTNGVNLTGKYRKNDSPFECICGSGNVDYVKFYLDLAKGRESDFGINYDDGFIRACIEGHNDIANFLLTLGANIHARNDSAIVKAFQNDKIDIITWLLSLVPREEYIQSIVASVISSNESNRNASNCKAIHLNGRLALDITTNENGEQVQRLVFEPNDPEAEEIENPTIEQMTQGSEEEVEEDYDVDFELKKTITYTFGALCKVVSFPVFKLYWDLLMSRIELDMNNCHLMYNLLAKDEEPIKEHEKIDEVVKFLFSCGAHIADADIKYIMGGACRTGNEKLITLLLDTYPAVDLDSTDLLKNAIQSGKIPAIECINSKNPTNIHSNEVELLKQCSKIDEDNDLVDVLKWLFEHGCQISGNDRIIVEIIIKREDPFSILKCVWELTNGCFNFRIEKNFLLCSILKTYDTNYFASKCDARYDLKPEKRALGYLVDISLNDYKVIVSQYGELKSVKILNWFATPHTITEIRQRLNMKTITKVDAVADSLCSICHEDKSEKIIANCGHHMCCTCFVNLYFVNNQPYTCPYCRNPVVWKDCTTIESNVQ